MNRKIFDNLSLNAKLDQIISFGKIIDKFESEDLEIVSYQMEGFVVDVQTNKNTRRLHKIVY